MSTGGSRMRLTEKHTGEAGPFISRGSRPVAPLQSCNPLVGAAFLASLVGTELNHFFFGRLQEKKKMRENGTPQIGRSRQESLANSGNGAWVERARGGGVYWLMALQPALD